MSGPGIDDVEPFFNNQIRTAKLNPETAKTLKNSTLRGIRLLPASEQKNLSKINIAYVESLLEAHYKDRLKDPGTINSYKARFRRGITLFLKSVDNDLNPSSPKDTEQNPEEEQKYNEVAHQIILQIGKLKPNQIPRLIKLINAYF